MQFSEQKQRILDLSYQHVCPHKVSTWQQQGIPLVVGRREGYYLWDLDGHRLIDLHLNGGTYNLGHRNPELLETMVEATQSLDIGNHHFPSVARAELAQQLAEQTPGDLTYSVFASGGSEANDIAIKTVRRATGRKNIVGLEAGYHGRTGLSGAAGEDASARFFLCDRPEEFIKVPFNDLEAMEMALSAGDVAAVILETIPATYGFPIPEEEYLPGVKSLCLQYGALFIADEVQTGLGRTGKLWGIEKFGVEPDILVTGKGFSGGVYPIAATVLTDRVAGWLKEYGWGHPSTFGGAEIGCRVAQKVLEICCRDGVMASVNAMSSYFGERLREIKGRQPYLTEIRQCGLVMGLRFDHPTGAVYMQKELYAKGIWAIACGFDQSVLQFKPGLLVDQGLGDDILERFEDALRVAKDQDYTVASRHKAAQPQATRG